MHASGLPSSVYGDLPAHRSRFCRSFVAGILRRIAVPSVPVRFASSVGSSISTPFCTGSEAVQPGRDVIRRVCLVETDLRSAFHSVLSLSDDTRRQYPVFYMKLIERLLQAAAELEQKNPSPAAPESVTMDMAAVDDSVDTTSPVTPYVLWLLDSNSLCCMVLLSFRSRGPGFGFVVNFRLVWLWTSNSLALLFCS